ncbi:uncharacterized protein MAM_08341 [Metarhizium album ARSEF 1941]|uniref:Uncharacterized protein n=1 Tax=Metarhizium album (strain ARSEF 1941) TaxID=1081103 RepID=A0A0B2WJG3_METAS|nr:uncharacterized protein MAM_08341 [Metarhizium album ARSEF 1941]KHN93814.1 hypothetical protein MAM_08341 [Metarhizium album ARSEF 1941]
MSMPEQCQLQCRGPWRSRNRNRGGGGGGSGSGGQRRGEERLWCRQLCIKSWCAPPAPPPPPSPEAFDRDCDCDFDRDPLQSGESYSPAQCSSSFFWNTSSSYSVHHPHRGTSQAKLPKPFPPPSS